MHVSYLQNDNTLDFLGIWWAKYIEEMANDPIYVHIYISVFIYQLHSYIYRSPWIFCIYIDIHIPAQSGTWNLSMTSWKRSFLLETWFYKAMRMVPLDVSQSCSVKDILSNLSPWSGQRIDLCKQLPSRKETGSGKSSAWWCLLRAPWQTLCPGYARLPHCRPPLQWTFAARRHGRKRRLHSQVFLGPVQVGQVKADQAFGVGKCHHGWIHWNGVRYSVPIIKRNGKQQHMFIYCV